MRDDPPGIGRYEREEAAAVEAAELHEIIANDFQVIDEETGEPYIELPAGLPFDEAECAYCAAPIGGMLIDNNRGGEAYGWAETWQTSGGLFICADCADMIREGRHPDEI